MLRFDLLVGFVDCCVWFGCLVVGLLDVVWLLCLFGCSCVAFCCSCVGLILVLCLVVGCGYCGFL